MLLVADELSGTVFSGTLSEPLPEPLYGISGEELYDLSELSELLKLSELSGNFSVTGPQPAIRKQARINANVFFITYPLAGVRYRSIAPS